MYLIEFSKHLERVLEKLQKKNRKQFEIILKKISEVKEQPEHYKPLRYGLKNLRRVHIDKSFVLVFEIIGDKILFLDFDHHDLIYKKRF
ncbi:type II toxin-antitoxin system RelE/ParE family toxin [Candidatus Micrarchaeota archaeon]|nr:type II toxin-antitoxin system RelE/ParE family toxin [Candidatus Micrarchaeota archaeon]